MMNGGGVSDVTNFFYKQQKAISTCLHTPEILLIANTNTNSNSKKNSVPPCVRVNVLSVTRNVFCLPLRVRVTCCYSTCYVLLAEPILAACF